MTASPCYVLSLHDALPIFRVAAAWIVDQVSRSVPRRKPHRSVRSDDPPRCGPDSADGEMASRGDDYEHERTDRPVFTSEEHTSELQSLTNIVCRLLLEKK